MEGMQLAEFILEKALAMGADMAECSVARITLTELDSEAGQIQLARSVASDSISLKVIVDQQKGTISLNQKDDKNVSQAIDNALKAATESSPDQAEGISDEKENGRIETGTLQTDLARLYTLLNKLINDTADEFPLVTFESATTSHTLKSVCYANTNGVRHEVKNGWNTISTMFSGSRDGKSSSFNYFGMYIPADCTNLLELDSVRRLLSDSEKQIDTTPSGEDLIEDVLLSPDCFSTLLEYAEMILLSDIPLISGTTPWKEKKGQPVASHRLVWKSCPNDSRLVSHKVLTGDGYIAKDNTLIDKGVLQNYSLSRYGAKATGQARSGNQHSMYIVEPGDKSIETIIGSVKRGLLVNRFSGGNPAPNGDFSGVAKNAFLIEDGRITKPVSETMISGNLIDVLKNIEGLSDKQFGDGARLVPWAHVKGISVTG